MGSITFTVSRGSPAFNGTKTYTVSDADVTRMINYLIVKYATLPTPAVPNPPALTPGQALLAWTNDRVDKLANEIQATERVQAINALVLNPPIVAT